LCALSGTTLEDVKKWAEAKRRERGGFSQGVVLIETRDRTLDEALSAEGPAFSLSPELGAEVQARRGSSRGGAPLRLGDEIEVPYEVPDHASRATRIIVDGVEIRVVFGGRGVMIERAHAETENPAQMRLDIHE
jgi:hypothetical protein